MFNLHMLLFIWEILSVEPLRFIYLHVICCIVMRNITTTWTATIICHKSITETEHLAS